MRLGVVLVLVMLAAQVPCASTLRAEDVRHPPRPGPREFVHDGADLITDEHLTQIRALCTLVLDTREAPIVVVTIPALGAYGAASWSIERYARSLFDAWGIGRPDWNHGILLLVSKGDRKARIELGADWGRDFDDRAQRIMAEDVTRHFREGRFSEGILAGVDGLAILAQGLDASSPRTPSPPASERATDDAYRPWYASPIVWGLGLLALATVVSMVRRGRAGWGYKTWTIVFAVLGVLLAVFGFLTWFRGGGRSSGGGGSSSSGGSSGSFGGGSSGGGGATGSW